MKLLMINNEFPPIGGGGSTVTKYALEYFSRKGYDVTLITSRYKDLPHREVVNGATVIRIPAIRRHKDVAAMWELVIFGISALVYTLWYVRKHRPDFIQAYFAVPAGWVAWIVWIFTRIPYGIYFGGSDIPGANPSRYKYVYPIITPLLRMVWKPAMFRAVCSKELAQLGHKADPSSEFLVIPNGVQTSRFAPKDRPRNEKVTILFIGRLIHRKGLQRVIQALPEVRKQAKHPFEVEVVGTGSYKAELERLAKDLNVSDLVRYTGLVPYSELERAYQGADVFVLTSLSEGMPSVILEAMGAGLPIVASDVGGNNEIVQEGENGYLIQGDDTDTLAQRLSLLVNNEDLRCTMGEVSRKMALQYDWNVIMARYDTLYKQYAHTALTEH